MAPQRCTGTGEPMRSGDHRPAAKTAEDRHRQAIDPRQILEVRVVPAPSWSRNHPPRLANMAVMRGYTPNAPVRRS
ncbi:hypothetical protein ACSBOX_06045 [Arthrobacter sp. KN11-1C]|uniref:hypothetical protein n=1 Tax=Arthrobacter sp. KN11-1C TaxID=3445774 RepID=UPI003FA0A8B3